MKSKLSSLNQEAYEKLHELDPSFAKKFKAENIVNDKKEFQIWPLRNKWWSDKRFDNTKKKI